jgi:Icc-related predicted phosphoesterase
MKLALCSDLHINFRDLPNWFFDNSSGADVLVVAGDTIETKYIHSVEPVFAKLFKLYPKVIIISGNHEPYESLITDSKQHMRDLSSKFDNLTYLDDEFINLGDDYVLVGSTLWTDFNNNNPMTQLWASSHMNDYRLIKTTNPLYIKKFPNDIPILKPSDTYNYHLESKAFIKEVVEGNNDKKVIVITHHAPSFQSVDDYFRHEVDGNGCYASDMDDFILEHQNIRLWQHGHMHHHKDYMIGECRVVCNPRGYPSDKGRDKDYYYDYKPLVVEI